jgi:hypothetical protein
MRQHRLQLVHAFRACDKEKRAEFCDAILQNMEDDSFLATFHLSGNVNRHNVRIWGTQNARETESMSVIPQKWTVLCHFSNKGLWSLHFRERNSAMTSFFSKMGHCHIGISRFQIS